MASVLDWANFGKMILNPLIDIYNLNPSKIEPLWSLMTKGERNKDKGERETKIRERYER